MFFFCFNDFFVCRSCFVARSRFICSNQLHVFLFRRLAKSLPIVFYKTHGGHSSKFKLLVGAIAALSGRFSFYCLYSSPSLAHLEAAKEGAEQKSINMSLKFHLETK